MKISRNTVIDSQDLNQTSSSSGFYSQTSTHSQPPTLINNSQQSLFGQFSSQPQSSSGSKIHTTTPNVTNSVTNSTSTSLNNFCSLNNPDSTTTTAHSRPEPPQAATLNSSGSADRSNLSLPTRRRNTQFDNVSLRDAASAILDGDSRKPESVVSMFLSMLSPDAQRSFGNDLSPGFQFRRSGSQNGYLLNNDVLETPTPTKIIYPKTVTEAQEKFAEGFNQALRQVQIQNQFVQTPSLQSPSAVNLLFPLLAALTPTLTQPSSFPGPSNLSSPVDGAQITRSDGTDAIIQLSPTAPQSSSTTTNLSPISDNSLISQLSGSANTSNLNGLANSIQSTLSSLSNSIQPTINSSVTSSTNNSFSEFVKQLDPNNTQGYMDIFNQHSDLSAAVSYSSFMNQNATSTSGSMIPQHLSQHSSQHSSSIPNNSSRLNGIAIKSEPHQIQTEPSPPQPLSAAVSALSAAAAMQSGGYQSQPQIMHQQSQQMQNPAHGSCAPHLNHQQPTTSNRYTSHSNHSVDMDDQERKKLERKRARNRAAASKCRQRKLERITELEGLVQEERRQNINLQTSIEKATQELNRLRNAVEEHRRSGCSLPLSFN